MIEEKDLINGRGYLIETSGYLYSASWIYDLFYSDDYCTTDYADCSYLGELPTDEDRYKLKIYVRGDII